MIFRIGRDFCGFLCHLWFFVTDHSWKVVVEFQLSVAAFAAASLTLEVPYVAPAVLTAAVVPAIPRAQDVASAVSFAVP